MDVKVIDELKDHMPVKKGREIKRAET